VGMCSLSDEYTLNKSGIFNKAKAVPLHATGGLGEGEEV
jgi:hypothetical protein